ncbi:hypothetical protein C1645_829929 [Glomus cerebriforme]|uniref:Uncharacterized protein n=1 Tax=Glomus cerebriforme TaxID=658196 RepID=A0A397STJ8_9GLOM|nr:hypothetical protein C1645_829929 [Glomus cerebriforme]
MTSDIDLLRNTVAENARRDVENVRRDAENAELEARVSSEKKIIDSFLDVVHKKIVSDGIRQRKWDEKLAKVGFIFPEKDKQVSVDKKTLRKKEQREKFIQEVFGNNLIPSVSSQRESDSSTNCSNIIDELGLNSLDVCLEQTVRSCDPLAVEMGMPTFSLFRILNEEVRAQLPADTSDALL